MAPVVLPRFVDFESADGVSMRQWYQEHHPYVGFWRQAETALNEVIPVPEHPEENVVKIRNLRSGYFWRLSPNWIWADAAPPSVRDDDCLFKVYQVGPEKVALQCLRNGRYVDSLTTDNKERALNTCLRTISPKWAFTVREGSKAREIYNVRYQFDRAVRPEKKTVTLDTARATNDTKGKATKSLALKYTLEKKTMWKDSLSFANKEGFKISAGIPEVADFEYEVSEEVTRATENGGEETKSRTFEATITVDVNPGETVVVTAEGTQADITVPFTYTTKYVLPDGSWSEEMNCTDGLFQGKDCFDVQFRAFYPETGRDDKFSGVNVKAV